MGCQKVAVAQVERRTRSLAKLAGNFSMLLFFFSSHEVDDLFSSAREDGPV